MSDCKHLLTGIVFDLDGVLIDSLDVMKQALSAALIDVYPGRQFDIDVLFTAYRQYLGLGFKQIMRNLELSEAMYEPFRFHSRRLADQVTLYEGTEAILQYCRSLNIPMAIATGKDYERTVELMNARDIFGYFDEIYASDTVTHPKPAPDMVLRFCQQFALTPADVLLIGDARADIQCGFAAGCQTAIARWGYGDEQEFRDLTFDYEFVTLHDALQKIQHLTTERL